MKTAFHQRLGAFGITATIGLFGGGMLLRTCTAAPTPAPVQSAVVVTTDVLQEVLNLTNQHRANAGMAPLALNAALTAAADGHSIYMASIQRCTHTGAGGTNPAKRMAAAGYRWSTWGENAAAGQPTAASVVDAWMNSVGHRANILNSAFTEIGLGAATAADGSIYWTMDLARPK